ncbi:hypothetical protein ACHAWF_014198 [Thalassiosira exigua]
MIGDGLVSLEGEAWSRHRRILQPCFQTGILKDALTAVIPSKVTNLIECWKKAEGRVIDTYAHMSAITLDILGEVSFAHDFNALASVSDWAADSNASEIGEIKDPLMQSLAKVFKPSIIGILLGTLGLGWLQQLFNSKRIKTKQVLDEAAEDIIQSARENPTVNTKSLIHMMLNATSMDGSCQGGRNSLTLRELKNELKVFIIAGHETTSTLCYWAFYALSKYPDIQAKVLQDIQKHATPKDQIDLDSIEKMEYFLAFVNECLRLYSPVGQIFRYTDRTEDWNGHIIPKKTRIIIPSSCCTATQITGQILRRSCRKGGCKVKMAHGI